MSVEPGGDAVKGEVYVIDQRARDFYMVDNVLITAYGCEIGPYAIVVYNCLACHANRERIAFPSYRLIADEVGISKSTAMRAVKTLEEWGIIEVRGEKKKGSQENEPNRYYLRPVEHWRPCLTGTGGVPQQPGVVSEISQVVSESDGGGVREPQEQNPVQQNEVNKTQQQHDVDAAARANALFEHGIRPRGLCSILAAVDGCAQQLEWWPLRRDEVKSWTPGTLRAAIEQQWAAPRCAQAAAPDPERARRVERAAEDRSRQREEHAGVYAALWDGLPVALREAIEREGHDRCAYIERYHADDLAAALRDRK